MYASVLGDIRLWVGVPVASSAVAAPLPELSSLQPQMSQMSDSTATLSHRSYQQWKLAMESPGSAPPPSTARPALSVSLQPAERRNLLLFF